MRVLSLLLRQSLVEIVVFVCFKCVEPVREFEWLSKEQREIKVCEGQKAVLDWRFEVLNTAAVSGKSWLHILDNTKVLQTFASEYGGFFDPRKGYTDRVYKKGGNDIALLNATIGDSGRYGLTINYNGKQQNTQWLTLIVMSPPEGGKGLTVTFQDNAENDTCCTLICGTLVHPGSPPVDFQWSTPVPMETSVNKGTEGVIYVRSKAHTGKYTCGLAGESLTCLENGSLLLKNATTWLTDLSGEKNGQGFWAGHLPHWAIPVIAVLCVCIAVLVIVGCVLVVKFSRAASTKRTDSSLDEAGVQCELSDT